MNSMPRESGGAVALGGCGQHVVQKCSSTMILLVYNLLRLWYAPLDMKRYRPTQPQIMCSPINGGTAVFGGLAYGNSITGVSGLNE